MYIKDLWNSDSKWDTSKIRSYVDDNQDVEDILKIYMPIKIYVKIRKFGLSLKMVKK